MRVVAHGIDIVEVRRVQEMIEAHDDRFLERCFTQHEREYCAGRKRAVEHFAARFAAKEAVFKALGTGWAQGVGWIDVEVVREGDLGPELRLAGAALERARSLGIDEWKLSLSHTSEYATASVIAGSSE